MKEYDAEHSQEISFPLGGIGSGCIGLAGNGRLGDWEIFNGSNKNSLLGFSHFCISAAGQYRLLQGDCFAPYTGKYRYRDDNAHHGFGWGVEPELLPGLPHYRHCRFRGAFPAAEVEFSGEEDFPIWAKLLAWSPFIPGRSRESSMPVAVLEYTFENCGGEALETTAVGVLANPWLNAGHFNEIQHGSRLLLGDGTENELVLELMEDAGEVSSQEYWYRGGWFDPLDMYLNDLSRNGRFAPRTYPAGAENPPRVHDHGLLAAHFTLAPHGSRKVTFVLSWYVPKRRNTWNEKAVKLADEQGIPQEWRNYYATQWPSAGAVLDEFSAHREELRTQTMRFGEILHRSALDPAIIDGASSCLAVLRSPASLRLEDGTLYSWEGVGTHWGSCEGSCTHVGNYAQAAAFLFPDLERSMRESHLKYSVQASGEAFFRLWLPLGIRVRPEWMWPCADGQFGEIMKFFREWKISGDDAWLAKYYPTLKKMLTYAWSKENKHLWDPQKCGVLTGRQHHTLDMELFGPNAWLTGHYLGALDAMRQMAAHLHDDGFSAECATILNKGRQAVKELFNGRYFQQKIDLHDRSLLEPYPGAVESYWNEESREIKYQIGEGLGIDACLGGFYAALYGIGEVFDRGMVVSTLKEIFRHNFRCAREHVNPWRHFAVNDERGVCICAWPEGKYRPAIPLSYYSEMMNGFEWCFAAHLLLLGMAGEAAEVARAVRERYDGKKRNPWCEFECGGNYARSMAAFGLIPAALGFRFDLTRQMIGFAPNVPELSRCFWSIGTAWGEYSREAGRISIEVAGGVLHLRELQLPLQVKALRLADDSLVDFSADEKGTVHLDVTLKERQRLDAEVCGA